MEASLPICHLRWGQLLILLHSERPKLYTILTFLSEIGLKERIRALREASFFL